MIEDWIDRLFPCCGCV